MICPKTASGLFYLIAKKSNGFWKDNFSLVITISIYCNLDKFIDTLDMVGFESNKHILLNTFILMPHTDKLLYLQQLTTDIMWAYGCQNFGYVIWRTNASPVSFIENLFSVLY